jgi:hypothetical protein
MARNLDQANLFELSGNGIQFTYSTSSFNGLLLFSYRDARLNCQFSGTEIDSQNTALGELITVILEQIVDLRIVTFTLILPDVNVLPRSAGLHIQVPAITTTTHTSIAGPALGPNKSYSPVNLDGTAQFIVF